MSALMLGKAGGDNEPAAVLRGNLPADTGLKALHLYVLRFGIGAGKKAFFPLIRMSAGHVGAVKE